MWAPHTLFISGSRVSQDMLRAPRARPESSGACDALWRSPSTSERELEMYSSSSLLQKACVGKQPLVQPLGRWTHKSGYMTALHKMSVSLMTHLCVALPLLHGWRFSLSSYRVPLPQALLSEAKTLCILLKRGVIWRCKNTIKLEDSGNIEEKVVNAHWKVEKDFTEKGQKLGLELQVNVSIEEVKSSRIGGCMTKLDPHDITDRNLHPHSVPHEVTGCRFAAERQSSFSSFTGLECFPMHRGCVGSSQSSHGGSQGHRSQVRASTIYPCGFIILMVVRNFQIGFTTF